MHPEILEKKANERTLETLMGEVERLALASDLPEAVDRKFWDQFICDTLERELF